MEYKVLLGENKFVRMPPTIKAGEQAVLDFDLGDYALGMLQATIHSGTVTRVRELDSTQLDITEFCQKACVIEIRLDLSYRGVIAKTWEFEPLVVSEHNDSYEVIPEIALMRQEINLMKQVIKEFNTKINDTM